MDSTNGDIHFNGGDDGVFGFYNDSGLNGRTEIIGAGIPRLVVTNFGLVGIGTTVPQASLDVRGNIRLGSSGELFSSSGNENLRTVRGVVDPNGNIITGSGFTVSHPSAGNYTITFNTPFAGPPAVTASAIRIGGVVMFANVGGVLSTYAEVATWNVPTLAAPIDAAGFHFIAVGPR